MKTTIIRLKDDNLWQKIRLYCFKNGISFNAFINELIEDFFRRTK